MTDAPSQPRQCGGANAVEEQEKQKIRHQIRHRDSHHAVDHGADGKSLSPEQRAHRSLGHVFEIINDDGRLDEESSGANIKVEDERPNKGEGMFRPRSRRRCCRRTSAPGSRQGSRPSRRSDKNCRPGRWRSRGRLSRGSLEAERSGSPGTERHPAFRKRSTRTCGRMFIFRPGRQGHSY
jgi:hypothetical protein